MSIYDEVKTAVENCSIGIDQTTLAGRLQVVNNCLDLFQGWRDDHARDYQAALETGDLSPNEFDAARNHRISV